MNLIFDVALPTDLRGRENTIREFVETNLNSEGAFTFHVRITFDIPET